MRHRESERPSRRSSAAKAISLGSAIAVLGSLMLAGPAHADSTRDKEYWLDSYGIRAAWDESQGEGVKVAVIDSGVDGTHPDLKGVVVGGTDASGSGDPDGQRGIGQTPEHGTLVATLLAGRGHAPDKDKKDDKKKDDESKPKDEGIGAGTDGVIGVAPKAQILTASTWLGTPNPSGVGVDEQIPAAVRWAVDNGAQVINMSLTSSSTSWPESWDAAFLYAEQHDVVVVAAAGNRAGGTEQSGAPATIPGVLTVAGLNRDGEASQEASAQSIVIGVAAPAEDLVGGLPGGLYADWSGTSGATPLVSGVAALIRSKYPDMSAAQVVNRIISTAKDSGVPGHDPIYGYGVLNAEAALNAEVPEVSANPLGSIAQWITVHRRGVVAAPESQSPVQSKAVAPDIPEPTTPVAVPPRTENSVLPAILVFSFGALIAGVLTLGAVQTVRARRAAAGKQAVEDADTGFIPPIRGGSHKPVKR
ncbi:S8 family serine peptidase [Arthrobacter sulfonylureivorans]|uniref:S8 family serine peptidase n=1 Tax=Arthrobacter sulfonylureivorans TaxID=2486855 RepID=A0ABY3W9P9_9MICC|nr:S8 family serine peptidase [Arthrobacter sulfonylureivorans]UNK45047.1 S8 family serine peptidase [Arthrobacter sulfonylureivorans]